MCITSFVHAAKFSVARSTSTFISNTRLKLAVIEPSKVARSCCPLLQGSPIMETASDFSFDLISSRCYPRLVILSEV